MILASVAGVLTGDRLARYFMDMPQMRALELLLEEKSGRAPRIRPRLDKDVEAPGQRLRVRQTRSGRVNAPLPDGHLLYGGGATYRVEADGAGFLKVRGVLAGRFGAGLVDGERDGMYVHARVDGRFADLTHSVQFGEGEAKWAGRAGEVECRLTQTLSPEDGALRQQIEVKNASLAPREIEVTGCFRVALCSEKELRAHPAFQHLFVKSESPRPGALLFTRNSRDGKATPRMVYAIDAPRRAVITSETDLARLTGREGSIDRPETLPRQLTGTLGFTLNPCAALRARFTLSPGDRQSVTFLTMICEDEACAERACHHFTGDSAARSRLLAATQARAMLDFLSIDARMHHLLQRASSFLFYPHLRIRQWADERLSLKGL